MKATFKILLITISAFFMSCGNKNDNNDNNPPVLGTNYLTMKINDVEWKSYTKTVFGLFHPTGYNDATHISGKIGEGAIQQIFSLNMYRTTGVGEYVFSHVTQSGYTTDHKVVQFVNLNPQDYLYVSLISFYNMKVKVIKVVTNPQLLEATFERTFTDGVRADIITVEPSSKKVLDELGKVLLKNSDVKISITSHTDDDGKDNDNHKLS